MFNSIHHRGTLINMSSSDSRTSPRPYSSELRAKQAEATRDKVVAAAVSLFGERGYAATTMPAIARRAHVSTETVQANGPKLALLREALNAVTFGGSNDTDVRQTPLGRALLAVVSPSDAVHAAAAVLTQVNASSHGLWLALSEAARGDESIAEAFRRMSDDIRGQTGAVLAEWTSRGMLRDDLDQAELLDRAVMVASVELYDRFVRVEGRSTDEYTRVLVGLLSDVLLGR